MSGGVGEAAAAARSGTQRMRARRRRGVGAHTRAGRAFVLVGRRTPPRPRQGGLEGGPHLDALHGHATTSRSARRRGKQGGNQTAAGISECRPRHDGSGGARTLRANAVRSVRQGASKALEASAATDVIAYSRGVAAASRRPPLPHFLHTCSRRRRDRTSRTRVGTPHN